MEGSCVVTEGGWKRRLKKAQRTEGVEVKLYLQYSGDSESLS